MKRRLLFILAIAGSTALPVASALAKQPISPESRADALLKEMTLDEKIGQMVQADSGGIKDKADVRKYGLGSVLSGGDSDPTTGNTVRDWINLVQPFQEQALLTRLKIPILYGVDAVHGHNNVDEATVFPHNIALGATQNPGLVKRAARVTAKEIAGTGIRWAFGPCVAVPQNTRWGRSYEGFGNNTKLVSALGVASVQGLQGKRLSTDPTSVLASAKHYIGDGGTIDGIDQGNAEYAESKFRELFLPPYKAAIEAGVGSIMVSYNSWNGQKLHGHKYLLTDVLKKELGFRGIVVSDYAGIDQLSPDYKRAIELTINAGMDMVMIPNGPGTKNNYVEFIDDLKALVAEGKVAQERIDDAVTRILRVTFEMGLFQNTAIDPALTAAIGSAAHRAVARQCVRESLVLIKDNKHLLPLSKSLKHLVVVGAGADDIGMQCGGWTVTWQGNRGNVIRGGTTLLAAIRQAVTPKTEVRFSPDGSDVAGADVVIVVVGETPYAEMKGDVKEVKLSDQDAALIAKAKTSRASVVTVVYSGRPLAMGAAMADSDAVVAAWLPGSEGQGMTDVLFGDFKFTGKTSQPWPQ